MVILEAGSTAIGAGAIVRKSILCVLWLVLAIDTVNREGSLPKTYGSTVVAVRIAVAKSVASCGLTLAPGSCPKY